MLHEYVPFLDCRVQYLYFMAFGLKVKRQFLMFVSQTQTNPQTAISIPPKSSSATKRRRKKVWWHLHCPPTHLHTTGLLCWWSSWQRSNSCFEASCLQPRRQMETLIFRDMRLCSIPTFDCPSSLFKPLSTWWSQSYPTLSHSHLGFRHWLRSISNVIPISLSSHLNPTLEFRIPSFHPHFLQPHFKIHASIQLFYYAIHLHSCI